MKALLGAGALAILLLGAAPAGAASDPEPDVVRVFALRHRRAEEAFLLVRPILTARGSVVLQPGPNTLTVRDVPAAVEQAARAVEAFDVPPRSVAISVSLLRASTAPATRPEPATPAPVAETIKGVGARLRKLFTFTDYASLDDVVLQGVEGEPVSWDLGGSHRIEFRLEPGGDPAVVRLRNLVLSRVRRDEKGRETVRDVARTTVNLRVKEPFVIGVGREEGGGAALFLVLTAAPAEPGPGIGGMR